ncbi:MAG: hypothetical protein JSV35_04635 [Candidatus Bathyarchaeota archaeon]|nr:MAG: hypothetical protein JSV35_04635 [Candidatus Bathyarchaeota archaeon]
MKGCYSSFPQEVHGVAQYPQPKSDADRTKVQQAILSALLKLNHQNFTLPHIVFASRRDCRVQFEIGVADDTVFNFLDREEANLLHAQYLKQMFDCLDFFCCVKYHIGTRQRPTPLKFDYFMFRFTFTKRLITLSLFHERGPRRVSSEELIKFLTERINLKIEDHQLLLQNPTTV